jgi:nicotinamidase-related amidase
MFELSIPKAALVIVDMQNDFVREGAPMQVEDAKATIEPTQRLIEFARKNEMPVIFTKFLIGPCHTFLWDWSPQAAEFHNCLRGYERYYPDIDKTVQCADVIDELKPILPEDYIIEKYGYSAFHNTNLFDVLISEGRDTIIVTGTVTQICVGDTVHDAFHYAIKTVVASDCVSSFSELQQKASLENFAKKYGMVMTSEEIMREFK